MSGSARIELPWPHAAQWPNGRPGHWAVKAKRTAAARYDGRMAALAAKAFEVKGERFLLTITAHPKRFGPAPDDDNIIAALKAARDGIADAMGVGDGAFVVGPVVRGERRPHGAIVISIEVEE